MRAGCSPHVSQFGTAAPPVVVLFEHEWTERAAKTLDSKVIEILTRLLWLLEAGIKDMNAQFKGSVNGYMRICSPLITLSK